MPKYEYSQDKIKKNRKHAFEIAQTLPNFVSDYLMAVASSTSSSTQLSYTYDIQHFINWWHDSVPELKDKQISEITAEDMSHVTPRDINEYLYTLQTTQNAKTLARKCTAIASLYSHLTDFCGLTENPMDKVKRPKIRKDKRIIKLEHDEVAALLDAVENGCPNMPEHQLKYLRSTKNRDYAIIMLLLGSGIRVSECVGLDIDDVNFPQHYLNITRKGGKKQQLPVSDEVLEAISGYLVERENMSTFAPKDERALFLSTRHTRLCPAAVENIVTKYTEALGFGKRITPHKLRKTYGTGLYQQTKDIYLVATALGHENVNTTTQHYVPSEIDALQEVRNAVKLKPDD